MMRFRILLTLAVVTLAHFGLAADKPNIVLVMADDQGWGDMAYNGHPTVKTPNFDEAAATGLRFDRFYAAAPVCSPTRASVMTGRHPNRMGVFRWGYPLRPQETTVAEALKQAGYATGHFGKWHLGSVRRQSDANPGVHGFDEWLSTPNFYDNDPILSHQGKAVPMEGESSVIAAEAALAWMKRQADKSNPFLCVVWFGSPHSPHRAVEQDQRHYADQAERDQHFLGEITGMDRAFGMIRNGLAGLDLREETILWYTSDNGALRNVGSAGPFRGNKGQVYDGGLLVPAILEWPAVIKVPRISQVRCNSSDIYPTLLEITGVTVDTQAPLDGTSLASLIRGETNALNRSMGFWDYPIRGISTPAAAWMKELYEAQLQGTDLPPKDVVPAASKLPDPKFPTSVFPGHAAWIEGDWKLHRIQDKAGNMRWELYDLVADPSESNNQFESQADRTKTLQMALESWLQSVVQSLNGEDY